MTSGGGTSIPSWPGRLAYSLEYHHSKNLEKNIDICNKLLRKSSKSDKIIFKK
jgi:hypothetical protein